MAIKGPQMADLRLLISLCKEYEIDYIKFGDIELRFRQDVVRPAVIADLDTDTEEAPPGPVYDNDYADPMLYPDGKDPIAGLRKFREERLARERSDGI